MALNRVKLGEFVTPFEECCGNPHLTTMDISGVNRDKEFFEPSKQVGADTSKYKNVPVGYFACNLMHVGRDRVLPIAYNHSSSTKVVSPAYSVFAFDGRGITSPEYFFMFLKSDEKDRYFWFNTDASIRDGMSWDDFCNLELELPPIEVQRKYVAVYEAMLANQRSYERGLDDLKLTCDGFIEELMRDHRHERIAPYISESDARNANVYGLDSVRGISILKKFIPTKAKMDGVSLVSYKTVEPRQISFVTVTSRNSDKITIAMNESQDTYLVSATYVVFECNKEKLLPEYLMLFFSRSEFDRYARFNSWGSARETFDWEDMQDVEIPIPDIKTQQAIADIYKAYRQRSEINERLKAQLKNLCPILIKGSIDEARAS